MNTFLMWFGGLLIAIFAALFAGPHFIDWNSYRGVFEEEATRLLGRRVRVGGNVNVRFLPAPYVLFENLRISDTTGIAGGPLFKTESFKMWLAVPPLLKGVLQANKVELERPVLALAADRDGHGNWRNLPDVKSLPFVPAGVKLDSVAIQDGTISYSIERGGEIARVEKITGELTAPALAGPYAFRGRAAYKGSQGNVRIASTEADASGAFRLTAHLSGWGANDHKFDGQVQGFWERPSLEGSLISRLTVAESGKDRNKPLVAEARSTLVASGQTMNLDGLTISFDEFAQPQIVTGSLTAIWAERHKVEVVLDSRWLDIDLLANGEAEGGTDGAAPALNTGDPSGAASRAKKAAAPLPMSRSLIAALLELFPGETDVTARLDVDQVNLGGETVSGLVVAMERSRGPLELRTLRAVLPGGARMNFSGRVESVGGQPVFDGDLFLGGVSAARVIHWGMGSSDLASPISDGPFSVSGRMQLGTNRVMLRSAVAEFSGIPIRGSINWDDGKRRVLELIVEGYEVDTRWFGLGKLELPALTELLSASDSDGASAQAQGKTGLYGWLDNEGREVFLDLKAGRLVDGTNTLRDVDAQFKVKGRTIQIQRFKLLTAEGLGVDLNGAVKGLGAQPEGKINFVVGAEDQAAAWKLADLWAGEAATPADRDRFAAFAPIRVAGQMQLGGRLKSAADFTFDGVAGGGSVDARLKIDGGLADWRGAPVDFVMRSEAVDTGRLFLSLAGVRTSEGAANTARDPGNVLVKAVGTPQSGLLSLMTVDSNAVSLMFDGNTKITDSGVSSLDGELVLRTGDVRQLVQLAGVTLPRGVGKLDYDGLADVAWTDGKLVVTPRDVKFAGSRVGGRVTVTDGEGGRSSVDGHFVADEGSLPRILAAVLSQPDERQAKLQVAEAAVQANDFAVADGGLSEEAPSIFSNRAFELSLLDSVTGTVNLTTNRLAIADGLVVRQAHAVVRAEADSLSLQIMDAKALGGGFEAGLTLAKAPAGAVAKGALSLTRIDVARLAVASGGNVADSGRNFGSGRANLELNFEGRGLTPRGVISVVTGSGKLQLDKVKLAGLSPTGIRYAAEAALAAEQYSSEQLRRLLGEAANGGLLELGSQDVQLRIADGALQVNRLEVDQKQGRSTVSMTADLRSLVLDSEWQVVMKDRKAGRPWPPVSVSYVGPLAKIGTLEARVVPDAFERELAVRKMERNVNELERLRQLDENAAAIQRTRRRQLELESQRIEAERAAAARRNGTVGGGQEDSGGAIDGWQATPSPAGAEPNVPKSDIDQPEVQRQEQSRRSKRRNRSRTYFRRKPKPKPFPNQIFGVE